VHTYVFCENRTSDNKPPAGFEFLADIFGEFTYVGDLEAPSTLYHWANADMVITSGARLLKADSWRAIWASLIIAGWPTLAGSSFTYLPGLISPKPVIIEAIPKEGQLDFYYLHDGIKLDDLGHVTTNMDVARARVMDRYQAFHHVRVPLAHSDL
jgi:hypothetical protein